MTLKQRRLNERLRAERMAAARAMGTHTDDEWFALLIEFCGCVRCGAQGVKLYKDHIKPIYQGGSDSIENLQPLCKSCNSSKGSDSTNFKELRRAEDGA